MKINVPKINVERYFIYYEGDGGLQCKRTSVIGRITYQTHFYFNVLW
jgi:hypothetical protein